MTRATHSLFILAALVAVVATSTAAGGQPKKLEALVQLKAPAGCLVDGTKAGCTPARALQGPGPFLGSNGLTVSPDGKHLYVASSGSDAIAIFARNASSGRLTQAAGTGGCVSEAGAGGCASAIGLDGPNSVAVSADGENVYATAVDSDAVTAFDRDSATGALTQVGCVADSAVSGCADGRALDGADVVAVAPDGQHVYVGAFTGAAVAVFSRDAATGALTQPADAAGCVTEGGTGGCTSSTSLAGAEGLAISPDGKSVYVAAAISNSVAVFSRDATTGTLAPAGCIAETARAGCTDGRQLAGPNAVAVSPDGENVYVTSLFSNSVTAFSRAASGGLEQLDRTAGCVKDVVPAACSLGHGLAAPEGIALSPDGDKAYVAAFKSNAVDSFNRKAKSGALIQRPVGAGCIANKRSRGCLDGRALRQTGGVTVSPDGKFIYATAFGSNAVVVLKHQLKKRSALGCNCAGR